MYLFFPLGWENSHVYSLSVWVVHLTKRTKGFISQTSCVGTLLWPSVPSFPTQIVKCFLSRTCLEAPFTIGPRISFMVGNIFAFSFLWGKIAFFEWPFLTLFFIVFAMDFSSLGSVGLN